MFYRTTADVPAGATMDHAMLSNGAVKVSFKTVAETDNGSTVFITTDIELPLAVVYSLGKIADKLVAIEPTLDEYDIAYLNDTEIAELSQLA
jgi:hypothetical protein